MNEETRANAVGNGHGRLFRWIRNDKRGLDFAKCREQPKLLREHISNNITYQRMNRRNEGAAPFETPDRIFFAKEDAKVIPQHCLQKYMDLLGNALDKVDAAVSERGRVLSENPHLPRRTLYIMRFFLWSDQFLPDKFSTRLASYAGNSIYHCLGFR